jgi:hypothetical protein
MASIEVPLNLNYDMRSIAEIAGQHDPDKIGYDLETEMLAVAEVDQEDLEAAIVSYEASFDNNALVTGKTKAKIAIDTKAEEVRLRYLTPGAGQAATYQEKAEEATDYVVAGYPADLTNYPFIEAEVLATGKTSTQAADDILAQKSAWITVGAQIERHRLAGKKDVDEALTIVAVEAERDACIANLDTL